MGCASLKPIENSDLEVPNNIPSELKDKFSISATAPPIPNASQSPIKTTNKKSKKSTHINNTAPIVPSPVVEKIESQNKEFNPNIGTKVVYAVYAPLGIRAGTLEVRVVGMKYLNTKPVIHLKANIYNAAFFNSIFKVNLLVESFVDPYHFKSLRYQVSGQEGQLTKKIIEIYDYDKNSVLEYKKITQNGKTEEKNSTHEVLNGPAQDILSAFFRLTTLNFNKTKEHTFLVASGDKVKAAKVVKLREEAIEEENFLVVGLAFEPGQDPNKHQIYINQKTGVVKQILADIKWGKFKVIMESYE